MDYFGARLIEDYERYTAACAVLESAERLAFADAAHDPYLYESVTATLEQLQTSDPTMALDVFCCRRCRMPAGHRAFSTAPSATGPARTTPFTRRLAGRRATNAGRRVPRR